LFLSLRELACDCRAADKALISKSPEFTSCGMKGQRKALGVLGAGTVERTRRPGYFFLSGEDCPWTRRNCGQQRRTLVKSKALIVLANSCIMPSLGQSAPRAFALAPSACRRLAL
jgi:hypothetical protein